MIAGRFTQNARNALNNAQLEAQQLGQNYVGTEHLLLGIIAVGESAASNILVEKGVAPEAIREHIVQLVGESEFDENGNFAMTPRSKNVMELSIREAKALNHNYVGTEHLLLALTREHSSIASRILSDLGVDLTALKDELLNMLKNQEMTKEKEQKTPKIDQFSRDLTELAKSGELDPVIGRQKEIERVVQILSRRTKNNPVLIGEPGVGKTAVAEGLAQKIVDGSIPFLLKNKRVLSLDLSGMLAGAKFRGQFEERLKDAIEEIHKSKNIILFIDELHTIIGAGAAEGSIDAANILKPALARGEIQAIGATTITEYRKHIEKDTALERRFQPVMVGEPTPEETILILKGLRDKYEAHHKLSITDEALDAAVKLSDRYITDRFLPDKAIDLMDEAASRMRILSYVEPPNMKEQEDALEEVHKQKLEAVTNQNFEKAAQMRDEEKKLVDKIEDMKKAWQKVQDKKKIVVGEKEIAKILSDWMSIPVQQLTQDESERLLDLEKELHKRVIGQDEAIGAVARAIKRARAGLKDPKRPIGSFIFLGPTGVGKTELCKTLAEAVFADEDALIRLDMSEYMERHSVSKLIGSPPGYVGYDDAGQLTEKVRRKPYSVILFDEIEKAHSDVFNILLQIFEDGRLTDSQGRAVDFRNTIIIMTSNIGAVKYGNQKTVGFSTDGIVAESEYNKMKDHMVEQMKKDFRPEFVNRIDEIVVFHALDEAHIEEIVKLMLDQVKERMLEKDMDVVFTDNARKYLVENGFEPEYGARPLRRLIQRIVEDGLAEALLEGKIKTGNTVTVDLVNGKLEFKAKK
ncbi:MAG: ATP-dependent Clp protease ATP-binding subunit [Clostridiales bacterium]|nr:ATP-dependent Clp protease ATP-binding subunit [Clostridiales bacterium]